jgi:hypothetical protein
MFVYINKTNLITSSQSLTADTITLVPGFTNECIAKTNFSLFTSTYATSCKCYCGEKGFKSPLKNIIFTATTNFDGIAPGNAINNKILFNNTSVNGISNYVSVNEYIDSLNKYNTYYYYNTNRAIIPNKPVTPFNGKINVAFIFENNDTVKAQTIDFGWQ